MVQATCPNNSRDDAFQSGAPETADEPSKAPQLKLNPGHHPARNSSYIRLMRHSEFI